MSVSLDGYRFERRLRSSAVAEVWTAVRERDHVPVIAKVFAIEDRPGLEVRVRHEFELIRALDVPGVVRALACERSGRRLYLLLEAHGGVDLSVYADGQPLALDRFFDIACRLTATLAQVHEQRVIHRDIKPTNVLVDDDGRDVMLADFGISVLLESERGCIHDPSIMRGTLPYVSPEQTGRTGREVDFRSDLYSLGVTFYELLTGRRPFVADSSLELIHAHLARRPEPPRRLRPELPQALSKLIMKLLEKAPERRYQSARGLLDDLERMRDAQAEGTLVAFELARSDVPLELQLPHQLYGREHERGLLRAGLDHALDDSPSVTLMLGESGLGKSALLDDLAGVVMGLGGRLLRGGFERGREEPLFGLTLALASLAEQLLTEAPDELARWQRLLRDGLGPLASVLTEIVPRFAALLGSGVVGAATSDAARNQIRQACVRVLELTADPQHPLVLALDDLQWADAATFELLDALIGSPRTGLAIVLTARPEAREPGSPLAAMLTRLDARERGRHEVVTLEPLTREQLGELLADTLSMAAEQLRELGDVVARKTGGNPFFVRQFLLFLYERELLRRTGEGWSWSIEQLAAARLPDDASEMLTGKLERLDDDARELVAAASVLGVDFDPALLGRMLGRPYLDVAARVLALVDEGLFSPSTAAARPGSDQGSFVFAHSRIREAAYEALTAAQRRRWHRLAGEQLHASLSAAQLEQRAYDVVEHLDRGFGLWNGGAASVDVSSVEPDRRCELLELNLRAGRRALATGLPVAARAYLQVAARLLERDTPPPNHHTLPPIGDPLHAVHVEVMTALASAEALTHAGDAAERRLQQLLDAELTLLERGEVGVERCRVLMMASRIEQALAAALEILAVLGVELPPRPSPLYVAQLLPRVLWMVRPAGLARVRELAPMQDRRIELAIDLAMTVVPALFTTSRELFVVAAARMAELCLEHGRHAATPLIFGQLGVVLANGLGRRRQAIEINRMCTQLAGDGPFAHRVAINGLFVRLWAEPLAGLVEPCERAFELAMARGDINSAALLRSMAVSYSLYGGVHLRSVEALVETRLRWVEQWGAQTDAPGGPEVIHACQLLREGPVPPLAIVDVLGLMSQPEAWPGRVESNFAMLTTLVAAVFGRWAAVYELLDTRVDAIEQLMRGSWYLGPARLLWGIACAELARDCHGAQLRSLRRKLAAAVTKLSDWRAEGGNFGHFVDMLEAELAVLDGDLPRASRLYESAREATFDQQNHLFCALASEREGRAWAAAGHRRLAIGPMLDARERYLTWGAFAKVEALDAEWPEIQRAVGPMTAAPATMDNSGERSTGSTGSTSSTANRALDVASLLKAAQTLAADLRVHEVLTKVMAIALENAGAQRGVLLLIAKGEISLVAEATVDHTESFLDDPPRLAEIGDRVPVSLLHYVQRTVEAVVLETVDKDSRFASDPYFRTLAGDGERMSAMCVPMIKRNRPVGLLYFENQLGAAAFGTERVELIQLMAGYAASALENARLYEDLRDSEIRWRSLVDQLPDYVVLVGRNGKLEYVNAVARPRQLGSFSFSAREFVGGQDAARVTAAVDQALRHGVREQLEAQVSLSGSDQRWYAVRVAPIAIDGAIDRAIVVATDIDDRRRAESERDQLEARLRQQQRLDSIGTLASGVAHEINNPIQGIMNYAELIAESEAADELIREFAGEIELETQRVATIVRQLLAFSRQELSEAVEPTAVASIVEGTVALIRAVMRRDQIRLDIEIPDDLPTVECRRQQLHQVIMNLVTNARDALNSRYRGYHEDKRIRISAVAFERDAEQWVRIIVGDKAGGVPADVVSRIFDPFFTTKGRDHGTGLGLAVSHGIISEHGGVLTLANHLGDGADFLVELPCIAGGRVAESA